MNCPACGKKTITVARWLAGMNSIVWTCPHCDTSLRISNRVVAVLILFAVAAIAVGIAGIYLRLSGAVDEAQGDSFVLSGLAWVVVVSTPAVCLTAWSGPYRPR